MRQAFSWVSICWGGSTPLKPSTTLTWCQITCSSHRGLGRSVSVWLGLSFSTCWGLIFLPMVGKRCYWGGWPSYRTLERHGGSIGGRHVLPISTPLLILLAGAAYDSLWGLRSSLMLVIFSFFALSIVACSLVNCVISRIVILHLSSCQLSSWI